MQEVVKQLTSAGAPLQKIYHARTSRKNAFGRYHEVEDSSGHIYGWPVGEYEWRFYDSYRGSDYARTVNTFVTPEGAFATMQNDNKPAVSRADTTYRAVSLPTWPGGPAVLQTNETRQKAEFLSAINDKLRSLLDQL